MKPVADWAGPLTAERLPESLLSADRPQVLRGVAADWPAVQAARRSSQAIADYLQGFWRDATVGFWLAPPEVGGRYFYTDESLSRLNFERRLVPLPTLLAELLRLQGEAQPPGLYMGSTTVDTTLPGFLAANRLGLGERDALLSIWLGNRGLAAAHYDVPDNLAIVVAGHRRFTLFPPDQVGNLYAGPLEPTPAGQVVSLVDWRAPDLQRYPRAAAALEAASVAELGPGDAIFIPSLWWHQVEALEDFNLLVNAWWRPVPAYVDTPAAALQLALLTLRGLPAAQRRAWQQLFNHHVFDAAEAEHLPPPVRGLLGPLDENLTRQARAQLLRRLNR